MLDDGEARGNEARGNLVTSGLRLLLIGGAQRSHWQSGAHHISILTGIQSDDG